MSQSAKQNIEKLSIFTYQYLSIGWNVIWSKRMYPTRHGIKMKINNAKFNFHCFNFFSLVDARWWMDELFHPTQKRRRSLLVAEVWSIEGWDQVVALIIHYLFMFQQKLYSSRSFYCQKRRRWNLLNTTKWVKPPVKILNSFSLMFHEFESFSIIFSTWMWLWLHYTLKYSTCSKKLWFQVVWSHRHQEWIYEITFEILKCRSCDINTWKNHRNFHH